MTGLKRCRKLQALTPGSAISEGAVRGRLFMFVSAAGSARTVQPAGRIHMVTDDLCGRCDITRPVSKVEELGEIDMVSRALGALDLVGHDDARPASPAVHLEGHTVLSYGELAGPAPVRARAVAGEGAVRYRGPGVMLGYAAGRADLCRGAQVDVLDTGDLGYLREGYLYLTGRAKRIVKVPGVRASLDDLEQMVDRPGHRAAVTCGAGDVVHLAGAGDPAVHEHQRRELAELPGVPGRHVVFRPAGQLPRTPGGKVGYQTLATVMDSRGGPVDGAEELAATLGPGT